ERLSRRVPIAGQNLCGEKRDPKRNFLQRLFANPGIYGPVVILESSGDRRDAPNRGTVTLSLDFVNIVSLLLVLNRDSYEAPKLWDSLSHGAAWIAPAGPYLSVRNVKLKKSAQT